MALIVQIITRWFAAWVVLFALIAFFMPSMFLPVKPAVPYLLGIIMFGMGMTLTLQDFRRVAVAPRAVSAGIFGQFVIMPLAGWTIAKALRLPPELAVGTILVGTCPSGTASNVMAFLARADVALSVTVTAVNTLLAPVLTPLLLKLLAGAYVHVNATQMFFEILAVVVAPTLAGLALNQYFPRISRRAAPVAPLLSVLGIVLIVSFIVAANKGRISQFGPLLAASVALHNAAGLAGGYWLARLVKLDESQCRAVGIEVGIQNSALDIQLAQKFFSHMPGMTLPGAFFSLWQNLTGPVLASWWSRRHAQTQRSEPNAIAW
jgi:BASS family bile acid:Na+ symporter